MRVSWGSLSLPPDQYNQDTRRQNALNRYEADLFQRVLPHLTEQDVQEPLKILGLAKTMLSGDRSSVDSIEKADGGELFSVLDPNGFLYPHMPSTAHPYGLFYKDMRHLNQLGITDAAGKPLQVVYGYSQPAPTWQYAAQPVNRQPVATVTRQDHMGTCHWDIRLRFNNPGPDPRRFFIHLGNDAQDIMAVRTEGRRLPPLPVAYQCLVRPRDAWLLAHISDPNGKMPGNTIGTYLQIWSEAAHSQHVGFMCNTDLPSANSNQVVLSVVVPPLTSQTHNLRLIPYNFLHAGTNAIPSGRSNGVANPSIRLEPMPGAESLTQIWHTADRDMRQLLIPVQCGQTSYLAPVAGIPNFVALFGRDSILAAWQLLPLNPAIAENTLLALAYFQGKRFNPFTQEEPGKILHEYRQGEMTRLGLTPHQPYYGSIDATPLFIMLLWEALRSSGNVSLLDPLWNSFEAALAWMNRNMAQSLEDPLGGFLVSRNPTSVSSAYELKNQGWKDADHALRHRLGSDGKLINPPYPLALAEVQAYAYGAWLAAAQLYQLQASRMVAANPRKWRFLTLARYYQQQAAGLKQRFNQRFWLPEQQFIATAVDSNGQPVRSIASNGLQALWTRIVDTDKAGRMIHRLLNPASDLLSPFGIRTLSAKEAAFDALSYQNGAIWPHDNWLIAEGLKRYGFTEGSLTIADRLFDAARQFKDSRLPELYASLPDQNGQPVVMPYPQASAPQAWASGTPLALLATLLGLHIDRLRHTVRFDTPVLPAGIQAIDLDNVVLDLTPGDLTSGYSTHSLNFRIQRMPGTYHAQVLLKHANGVQAGAIGMQTGENGTVEFSMPSGASRPGFRGAA